MTLKGPATAMTFGDLEQLIQGGETEGRTLEFKRALPASSDKDKQELCADVSAMANTQGGYVLFGVDEDDRAAAKALVGIPSESVDREILRLSATLRSGVEPPIPACTMHAVSIDGQRSVLVVQVERSWRTPHLVKCGDSFRMYIRESRGKRMLDEREIRAGYEHGSELPQRLRRWRADRIAAILSGDTPSAVPQGGTLVVHVAPISAFIRDDLVGVAQLRALKDFAPIGSSGWDSRYNLDGVVNWDEKGYTQLFRSGCVEAVSSRLFALGYQRPVIASTYFEAKCAQLVHQSLRANNQLDLGYPVFVAIALLGMQGAVMPTDPRQDDSHPIDRQNLLLPELILEEQPEDVSIALRPIFDAAWNASGLSGSPNYLSNGRHTEFKSGLGFGGAIR